MAVHESVNRQYGKIKGLMEKFWHVLCSPWLKEGSRREPCLWNARREPCLWNVLKLSHSLTHFSKHLSGLFIHSFVCLLVYLLLISCEHKIITCAYRIKKISLKDFLGTFVHFWHVAWKYCMSWNSCSNIQQMHQRGLLSQIQI